MFLHLLFFGEIYNIFLNSALAVHIWTIVSDNHECCGECNDKKKNRWL